MAFVPTPVALARSQPVLRAISDGRRLGVATAHIDGASEVFRSLRGHWFAPRRMWVLPEPVDIGAVQARLSRAVQHSSFVSFENFPELATQAQEVPVADFFVEVLDVQVMPLVNGRFAVSGVYDQWFVKAMRSLRGLFHQYANAWEVACELEKILVTLHEVAGIDPVYVFVHEQRMQIEDLSGKPKSEIPISVDGAPPEAGTSDGSRIEDTGKGFLSLIARPLEHRAIDEALLAKLTDLASLLPHQIDGVRHLASWSSSLLADDMGLGKTRQAVVASRMVSGDRQILITCPASLRYNWVNEIRMVFPEDFIGLVGEDRLETLRHCKWVIGNYERLGALVCAEQFNFEVFTVDEAHYLKEHKAGRTKNAFIMADRIPRKFLLTGTPILNHEIELHTLLRMAGHPLGHMDLKTFRKKYAGGKVQREALAQALSGWMLRRSKKVLKGLGLKTRQVRYITPDGIDSYDRILRDPSLQVMPKIVKLRQTLEALKADYLIETVMSLQQDDKVIVFCEYTESISFLKTAFEAVGIGVVTLDGSMSTAARQKSVDRFQADPSVRIFLGTTSAAGVGITLTAANYVIFASLPWTPALKRQAEDRAYRLGQRRDVFVLIPIIPGTIDEQILALLQNKEEIEEDVVERQVALGLSQPKRTGSFLTAIHA